MSTSPHAIERLKRLSCLISESENLALLKIKHALEKERRERLTTSEVIRELIKRSSK